MSTDVMSLEGVEIVCGRVGRRVGGEYHVYGVLVDGELEISPAGEEAVKNANHPQATKERVKPVRKSDGEA